MTPLLSLGRKKKVGLALGGGAARGLAHIGVLAVLEMEDIPVDVVAGTSIGAAIGALYAMGKSPAEIKMLTSGLLENWKNRLQLFDVIPFKNGLIAGNRLKEMLRSLVGDVQFHELRRPFACVATDILTGEEVVLREGSVWEAVRASISLPVVFRVVRSQGRYLVDGGLVNPVPVSVAQGLGADFTIAVNVIRPSVERLRAQKEPGLFAVALQSFYISTHAEARVCLEKADAAIEPEMPGIGYAEFQRLHECIVLGELAAQARIPELRRRLKARGLRLPGAAAGSRPGRPV